MVYDGPRRSPYYGIVGRLAEEYQGSVLPYFNLSIALIHYADPIFLSLLNDILLSIVSSKTSGVYETAIKEALPRLTTSIGNYNANESWVASSALELTGSLARGAPETGLGKGFFAAIAPTVFDCLRVAEDRDILQVRVCPYHQSCAALHGGCLERHLTPDTRSAQGRRPTPFMDACGWPIGSRTRANGYSSPAAKPR